MCLWCLFLSTHLAHKGGKLSRWMTPPTAIAAIASFHVHAVWHIIHSPCICVQQPASTSKREALLLSTCHHKPTQPGSSLLSGYRGGTYVPKTIWISQNHYQPKPVHTCGAPKLPRAKAFAASQRGIAPPKTETLTQCPVKSQPPLTRENESKVSGHLQGRGHPSTESSPRHHLGTYTPSRWRPSTSVTPRKRKVLKTKQIYPISRE